MLKRSFKNIWNSGHLRFVNKSVGDLPDMVTEVLQQRGVWLLKSLNSLGSS